MNLFIYWFASPAWARMVETLLHSLWQGAVMAVGLGMALRWVTRPEARYRLALLALAGTVAASLVTWAVLQTAPLPRSSPAKPAAVAAGNNITTPAQADAAGVVNPTAPPADGAMPTQRSGSGMPNRPPVRWSAWLAVVWLLGAAGMLVRAGSQVAGAGRVRQSCQPLTEGPVPEMLEQLQKSLGVARRVRVMVTDRLTSPAVAGVLLPVLILPGSLLTALTPEQLRFILLHELAHIRRGDYLVNLCQLLVEALLFFNPAVWWLSRQIRLEREACCDAVAIERSGAPTEYARTLLHVAERYAAGEPTAALAFGDRREPSGLAERIQRLLSPNHRPHLRLTWRAMAGSLLAGCGLLVLMAVGTRITVEAILTPQERMDRIEKVLVENGQAADADVLPADDNSASENLTFSGRVRTEDGGPLPKYLWINQHLQGAGNASYGTSVLKDKDDTFKGACRQGRLTLSMEAPGYAPCIVGPLKMQGTNPVTGIELVLRRGFAVALQMVDADSGAPLAEAPVAAVFISPNNNIAGRQLTTDLQGRAVMTNCASLPMEVTGNADGYEIIQQTFAALTPDETLRLATRRGLATTGRVWDKISGQPVAGAVIQVLRQQGAREASYDWDHRALRLTTVDRDGRFATAGLQRGSSYRLGVSAPGHESAVLNGAQAGDTNLVARLGPELVVHGRITGDVGPVSQLGVSYTIIDREVNSSSQYAAHYWPTNGGVEFQFTNRMAGLVELAMRGFQQTREVDAPVADWRVELTNSPVRPAAPADSDPPEVRDVVVRLKAVSGIPPRGAIDLNVPVDLHSLHLYHTEKAALQNGAVVVKVPVGADIEYAPGQSTLGYWFESGRTNVTAGRGPLLIEVPVIPAGVITARARNADGSPAGDLFFSVKGLKSAPGVKNREANYGGGDTRSDNAPRTYLSPPLPLDGTYEIIGWRGNSFCVSAPTTLTEAAPDAAVELQFSAGQDLTGRVLAPDGQPLRGAEVTEEIDVDGNGFQLNQPAFTDAKGEFRVTGCTPELAHYTLNIAPPGCVAEQVRVDFKRLPLTVKLKAGLKLTGRVVKAATGRGVPNAEVRVVAQGGPWLPGTTRTDADGNFDFNTLGEATYQIYVNGAYFIHRDTVNSGLIKDTQYQQKEFRAGVETNLLLEVTPYPGSQLAE